MHWGAPLGRALLQTSAVLTAACPSWCTQISFLETRSNRCDGMGDGMLICCKGSTARGWHWRVHHQSCRHKASWLLNGCRVPAASTLHCDVSGAAAAASQSVDRTELTLLCAEGCKGSLRGAKRGAPHDAGSGALCASPPCTRLDTLLPTSLSLPGFPSIQEGTKRPRASSLS